MTMQRKIGVLALAVAMSGMAACHPHGRAPRAAPVVQPDVDLARALDLFRHGDFRRAQVILQRVSFELPPGSPALAQARYYIAESWFQVGDYVQAASEFRKVADEFSTTEYAPLALLRGGDLGAGFGRSAKSRGCRGRGGPCGAFFPTPPGPAPPCPPGAISRGPSPPPPPPWPGGREGGGGGAVRRLVRPRSCRTF